MTLSFPRLIFLSIALGFMIPGGAALAQSCGGVEDPPCQPGPIPISPNPEGGPPASDGESLNNGYTQSIAKIIQGANKTCDQRILLRYRVDCLRLYYERVAERLPDRGDYLPVKQAMLDAAAKLDAIVVANLDPGAPEIRPRDGHKPAARRTDPIRAVTEEKAEAAAAQAAAVVKETELIILRSGGDPARRTQHYTDIAAAVESNLVILRSA